MTLVAQQVHRSLQTYSVANEEKQTQFLRQSAYKLSGHSGPVYEVHFSPSGNILASCSSEVILWSVSDEVENIGSVQSHKYAITSLSWCLDSSRFATASADKTVVVQDTSTGTIIRRFTQSKEIVNSVQYFKQFPTLLASGDDSGAVILYDERMSDTVTTIKSKSPVTSLSIVDDKVCVAGVCGNVYINEFTEGRTRMDIHIPGSSAVHGIALDSNKENLARLTSDGVLSIANARPFSARPDRILHNLYVCEQEQTILPPRVAFSHSGRLVACGSTDGMLRVWDMNDLYSQTPLFCLPGHTETLLGVDFHPELPIIATSSSDMSVIVGEIEFNRHDL